MPGRRCPKFSSIHSPSFREDVTMSLRSFRNPSLVRSRNRARAKTKFILPARPPARSPEGRADFYRRLGEGGTKLEKAYQVSIIRLEECKFRAFQRGNRGTPATLTDSTIFSITNNDKVQPEVHLGDNKGTSEVHPGHTNHTDTLITPSTMSTKHTHNRTTLPAHQHRHLGFRASSLIPVHP